MNSVAEIITEVLSRPARGRRAANGVEASVTRQLVAEDIVRLSSVKEGGLGTSLRPLQRIRHSHHMMAQLLASGEKHETVALATGYDPAYISNLLRDPSFKELVTHYKSQVEEVSLEVSTRLRSLGLDSVDELQARLVEKPDSFTSRELMELAELTLDRSGHGPTSNVRLDARVALISGAALSRIKQEVSGEARGTVAQLEPPRHSPLAVGEVLDLLPVSEAEGTARSEGSGAEVPAEGGRDP